MAKSTTPPTTGTLVRTRREELKLTQGDLGGKCKCDAHTISCIENDHRLPCLEVALWLSVVLDIPLDIFLANTLAERRDAHEANEKLMGYKKKK